MSVANLVGGSERDREQILQLHADYIDANARFDWGKLEPTWSAAPEAVFFNLNGHTYKGREHWVRLWKFITRSTMVLRKEAGGWRVVHAHFSEASSGERPGGV